MKNKLLTGLVCGMLAIGSCEKEERDVGAPKFHNIVRKDVVGFMDDYAPELSVSIYYRGEWKNLDNVGIGEHYSQFRVPPIILNRLNGQFFLKAFDREHEISVSLYAEGGKIYLKRPKR